MTETGHALYGGEPGLSDTWLSTPWWLDQLCLAAHEGIEAVFRQSLIGGDYGLLDETTCRPRPDYYASFLWKRLLGSAVYEKPLVDGPDRKMRAWHHGGRKRGDWLVLINLNVRNPCRVELPRPIRRSLVLEPDAGPRSIRILLNGVPVEPSLVDAWGSSGIKRRYGLRPRPPSAAELRGIEMPPLSCAFVELFGGPERGASE